MGAGNRIIRKEHEVDQMTLPLGMQNRGGIVLTVVCMMPLIGCGPAVLEEMPAGWPEQWGGAAVVSYACGSGVCQQRYRRRGS